MKKLAILFLVFSVSMLSCKSKYDQNEAGFSQLESDLKEKFGAEAFYTIINMSAAGDETMGYTIFVDKTDAAEDIRQERWVLDGGSWMNAGYANMQIDRNDPKFYKFQLGKEVNLSRLGQLIEASKTRFTQDGKGSDPVMKLAQVNTNNTVQDADGKYQYTVKLAQKGEQEEHSYTYDRNGKLIQSY